LAQPGEVFHLKTVFVNSWMPNLPMINLLSCSARYRGLNISFGKINFLQRCSKFRQSDGVNLRHS